MNDQQPQPPVPPQGESHRPTSQRPSFADTYRAVQAAQSGRAEEDVVEDKVERPVTAFVVVDAQNDFSQGGSLAVAGAIEAYKATHRHLAGRAGKYSVLVTTRDNHIDPGDHWSDEPDFVDSWPRHCAAGEPGSDYHPEMKRALDYFAAVNPQVPRIDVTKGEYEAAYSGFEGKTEAGVTLADALRAADVERLEVVGVATDHCVRATVLDGLKEGFDVAVFTNQIAAVDDARGKASLDEMAAAGAEILDK
ncbi:isochorismatase family protein [uncultured Corynebacterium sp.]|uniref:isochorismatase family protein n=1 Tax=uncultured Corynebacterium sp. TaxID=159447 RepID=UPI00345C03A0